MPIYGILQTRVPFQLHKLNVMFSVSSHKKSTTVLVIYSHNQHHYKHIQSHLVLYNLFKINIFKTSRYFYRNCVNISQQNKCQYMASFKPKFLFNYVSLTYSVSSHRNQTTVFVAYSHNQRDYPHSYMVITLSKNKTNRTDVPMTFHSHRDRNEQAYHKHLFMPQ